MSTEAPIEAGQNTAESGVDAADRAAGAAASQASGMVEIESGGRGGPGAAGLFPRITPAGDGANQNDFDMVMEIPVELTVELGRTKIPIGKVLQLAHGSVIELDAPASEPMDVYVNGLLIAQGEVVIVNDKFGLRLTDIVTPAERIRRLGKR